MLAIHGTTELLNLLSDDCNDQLYFLITVNKIKLEYYLNKRMHSLKVLMLG